MNLARRGLWEVQVEDWSISGSGRRIGVTALLVNRAAFVGIPDPRVLRPTLRCLSSQALAVSDIFRAQEERSTVYRPVVQPGGRVRVRFLFDNLPLDRRPGHLTLGDGIEGQVWPVPERIGSKTP